MRFDSYHPGINLIYFASVIAATICFRHPVFLGISYLCAFAYAVKLNGKRSLVLNLALIPLMLAWTLYYASYHHFGATPLRQNMIGNSITLESLVYGGVIGVICAGVIMWMSCVHAVFSTDKLIYLLGRIAPRLSLFAAILLRAVPRIAARGKHIATAQSAIGRGVWQGNLLSRLHNRMRILSILIAWTIEAFVATADSMRCRGYTLKGRTAFSLYRFDHRDRSFVIALFLCLTILMVGMLFQQTSIHYNPRIIMNRITPLSAVFYLAYAVLALMPLSLQLAGEIRFARLLGLAPVQTMGYNENEFE